MTRITASFLGNLERFVADEIKAGETAVSAGIKAATDGLKLDLRSRVQNARLGRRLANTIRGVTFPKGRKSMGAAGLVFSKAPKLIEVFSEGANIRAKNKRFLAIPLDTVPKSKGKTPRPSPRILEINLGTKLFFVPRKGKNPLLAAELTANKAGTRAKVGTDRQRKSGVRKVLVAFYVLVKQTRVSKRLDLNRPAEKWAGKVPGLILGAWPEPVDA